MEFQSSKVITTEQHEQSDFADAICLNHEMHLLLPHAASSLRLAS